MPVPDMWVLYRYCTTHSMLFQLQQFNIKFSTIIGNGNNQPWDSLRLAAKLARLYERLPPPSFIRLIFRRAINTASQQHWCLSKKIKEKKLNQNFNFRNWSTTSKQPLRPQCASILLPLPLSLKNKSSNSSTRQTWPLPVPKKIHHHRQHPANGWTI